VVLENVNVPTRYRPFMASTASRTTTIGRIRANSSSIEWMPRRSRYTPISQKTTTSVSATTGAAAA
jgi:hypothetical protein